MTSEGMADEKCSGLGGLCQARGPHTTHWWSSEQAIRDLGLTRGVDGRITAGASA